MTSPGKIDLRLLPTCLCIGALLLAGCQPLWYWQQADNAATGIIAHQQVEAFGETSPFTIERPVDTLRRRLLIDQQLPRSSEASLGTDQLQPVDYWPEHACPPVVGTEGDPLAAAGDGSVLRLTLMDALQVAAANARDYQTRKEDVYRAALALDLQNDAFRNTFAGVLEAVQTHELAKNASYRGNEYGAGLDWTRKLEMGAEITAGLALDLVKLLTADRDSSFGILADATITVPLLRGAGRHIVTEPMTQAQRNVMYSLYSLERFKRTLAVRVATEYLAVLQQLDQVQNAAEHYGRLIANVRRGRRLADAGRLPEIQVDQARQDELRARDAWIIAQQSYKQRLDRFKITLGLPTDANIELDTDELERLAHAARERLPEDVDGVDSSVDSPLRSDDVVELPPPSRQGGGPFEMPQRLAVEVALSRRLDLRTTIGEVFDAQRQIAVTANALQMGLAFTSTARAGATRSLTSAGLPAAQLRPEDGRYTFGLSLDLPLERTAEQDAYRSSFITLEQAVRSVQQLEDQIKLDVRSDLRKLLQARESFVIRAKAVTVAYRRVESTTLFLQAGRAEMRDVLEAEEALVSAQDALTASLVDYRVAELELQRDMGVLEIDDRGLWHEYTPE